MKPERTSQQLSSMVPAPTSLNDRLGCGSVAQGDPPHTLLWSEFFITAPGREDEHCPSGIWMAVTASCSSLGYCPQDQVLGGLQDPASASPGASSLGSSCHLASFCEPNTEPFHFHYCPTWSFHSFRSFPYLPSAQKADSLMSVSTEESLMILNSASASSLLGAP